jgi:hypothetical protein
MSLDQLRTKLLPYIVFRVTQARRRKIDAVLFDQFSGVVQDGPFKGMNLPAAASWGKGDLAPKLLGCYEAELHTVVREFANCGHATVVNVGSAEGYYTIGFARLIPDATVWAFDCDSKAGAVCRLAARGNDVHHRVRVDGLCDVATLRQILSQCSGAILLLDCEGAEKHLLDPATVPQLAHCDFIVECHDFLDRSITPTLQARFEKTHELQLIDESSRNPNYAVLKELSSLDRWLAVCEFRPEAMHWLVGRSKSVRRIFPTPLIRQGLMDG